MNRTRHTRTLPILAGPLLGLAVLPAAALAQTPFRVVDDFASGKLPAVTLTSDVVPDEVLRVQAGTMAGGYRTVYYAVAADTAVPATLTGRKCSLAVDGGRLLVENGLDVVHQLVLDWGFDRQGDPVPLDIDLEPIREGGSLSIAFHTLDTVVTVNALLFTGSGDVFQQATEHAASTLPHALDLALTGFTSNVSGLPPGEGDLADVDRIEIAVQSGDRNTDFALDEVAFHDCSPCE